MCAHRAVITAFFHFMREEKNPAFKANSKLHDCVYHSNTKIAVYRRHVNACCM